MKVRLTKCRYWAALVALVGLTLSAATAAADVEGWTDEAARVDATKLKPLLRSEEAYTERYTLFAKLDGGGHVDVDFTISNLGFGDGHGAVTVEVVRPGKKTYDFKKKVDRDEWTVKTSPFRLEIARTRLERKGKGEFRLIHRGDVSFDLTFENTAPPWQPGRGQITDGDDFFRLALISPHARVKGDISTADAKQAVEGVGHADHNVTTFAPFDLARHFARFRAEEGKVFVAWREVRLTDEMGGESLTWIIVGYDGDIVFSSADAKIKWGKTKEDSATGYRVPMAIQIDASDGDDSVRLVMKGRSVTKTDLLAEYGAAARLVASAVSKPFQFDVSSSFTLQMKISGTRATVKGKNNYIIDILND